jgi:hypothetical protein
MRRVAGNLARIGTVAAVAVVSACTTSRPPSTASESGTPLPPQGAITTTTTAMTAPQSQPLLQKLGEPFTLGDLRLTMLAVQDPFPSTPQVQPAPGNRLVSIKYEVLSQSSDFKKLSELPVIELRDSTGAGYRSEHGRVSVVGGSGAPGELPAGKIMESNAVFEVPDSASGLQVTFRSLVSPSEQQVVTLN